MSNDDLRVLAPQVLGVLVRRGYDFAAAEDALQEALLAAHQQWPERRPDDPKGWLVTVAARRLIDAHRSDTARRRREEAAHDEPDAGPAEQADDTLLLLFLCCHPSLSPASAIALTLRAVGGLTTKDIADAFLVPEATMAQRIARAKRTVAGQQFTRPADIAVVLRVLYLIFNEGYGSRVDLAAEAIRLTRQLARESSEPEVAGLLALMLLHHARRAARFEVDGALISLDQQDRRRWDRAEIGEGVAILHTALAADRRGEYQIQAAIAALHDDAQTVEETDWTQLLAWYDELVALTGNPAAALSRAVVVGAVDGPLAGLRATEGLESALPDHHRLAAVRAYLHEQAGDLERAEAGYARAATGTRSTAERVHLTKQAARVRGLRAESVPSASVVSVTDPAAIEPDDKDWTWVLDRPCPDCGYLASATATHQLGSSLPVPVTTLRHALARADAAVRPSPAVWSALEYGAHVRDVCLIFRTRLQLILDEDDPVFANWDQDETARRERYWEQDPGVVSGELDRAAAEMAAAIDRIEPAQWHRPGRRSNGSTFTAESLCRYFLHDLVHHAHDVGAAAQ